MSNLSSTSSSLSNISPNCFPELWYYQIGLSLSISAVLCILARVVLALHRCWPEKSHCKLPKAKLLLMKAFSEKSLFGKLINILRLLATITSGSIFIFVLYREHKKDAGKVGFYSQIYFCIPWTEDYLLIADFVLQGLFFVLFSMSVFVSSSIPRKISSFGAIIEYFNIIPQVMMVIFQRHNYGFRFVNFLRLRNTTKILLQLNILSNYRNILLSHLVCTFFSVWLTSAGIFQLLDALDENFKGTIPAVKLTYFDSMYFLMVTMSTVGYGDILPITTASRIFIVIVIVFSISYFASVIPELMANISDGKYQGSAKLTLGQKHVVICGGISYDSVLSFISDFHSGLRQDSNDDKQIVFLSTIAPDTRLETLCLRKWTDIQFLLGDPTNVEDLRRAKIKEANCVIILPDKEGNEFLADSRSVLQMISVKNEAPDVRIIIELLDLSNSELVTCTPNWIQDRGTKSDLIISIVDLKIKLLSYSSAVPGFSTLMTNYLTRFGASAKPKCPRDNWEINYSSGAFYSLFNVSFSQSLDGLTFNEAVKVSYQSLSLILVGVWDSRKGQILINPGPNFQINITFMTSIVLAASSNLAKRIEAYCRDCHPPNDGMGHSKCGCGNKKKKLDIEMTSCQYTKSMETDHFPDPIIALPYEKLNSGGPAQWSKFFKSANQIDLIPTSVTKIFQIIPVTLQQAQSIEFKSHIVICLPCYQASPLDLTNYIQSIREFISNPAQHIVIITSRDIIAFNLLSNIYHLKASPLTDLVLRSVNLHRARSCLILSPRDSDNLNPAQLSCYRDKFSILCGLKVKSFLKVYSRKYEEISDVDSNDQLIYPMGRAKDHVRFGFATGATVNNSILNAFISTALSNPIALLFLNELLLPLSIQQVQITETDNIEDNLTQNHSSQQKQPMLNFLKVDQSPFALPNKVRLNYQGLFTRTDDEDSIDRFVFACPPKHVIVQKADYVYFLR